MGASPYFERWAAESDKWTAQEDRFPVARRVSEQVLLAKPASLHGNAGSVMAKAGRSFMIRVRIRTILGNRSAGFSEQKVRERRFAVRGLGLSAA
jgi:hypothetical protein